jgi:hypothetical protein
VALPAEVRSHHTVWVDLPGGGRSVALRYAADDDRLICLGDDGLASVPAGSRVIASLRALACGPHVSTFWVRVEDLAADEVSLGLLAEVLGDQPLGRTSDEVSRALEAIRTGRRLVALAA